MMPTPADRLRTWPGAIDPDYQEQYEKLLDEALAAERRATVERIRDRIESFSRYDGTDVLAILDEEAAR